MTKEYFNKLDENRNRKIVIFDWGGVIINHYPDINNTKDAIIRTIKSFNPNLTNDEAYSIYQKTLLDENGIYISRQDDDESKRKWIERIKMAGNFETTLDEFSTRFSKEYEKVGYYKEVVEYVHSLKGKCKIGLFSDLIYTCYSALDKQVDLSQFDYTWLSYQTHLRKNTEEAFALVEQDLQVSPHNIMFIDDTTINIENARKRGWNTCQARGSELSKMKEEIEKFLSKNIKSESSDVNEPQIIKFDLSELEKQNTGFAYYILGRSYDLEENGVNKDYNKALYYYKKGLDMNYPLSIYSLGVSYQFGLGDILEVNKEKAETLLMNAYPKIIELINNPDVSEIERIYAKFVIGAYYYFGLGNIDKDYKKAFEIIKECANQGHIAAIYDLGANFYFNGNGTDINYELSEYYLNIARENGLKRAIAKCEGKKEIR